MEKCESNIEEYYKGKNKAISDEEIIDLLQ